MNPTLCKRLSGSKDRKGEVIRVRCGSGGSTYTYRVTCTRDAAGDCLVSVTLRSEGQDPVELDKKKVSSEAWELTQEHSRSDPDGFALMYAL
jgi:hypothetical protein